MCLGQHTTEEASRDGDLVRIDGERGHDVGINIDIMDSLAGQPAVD